MSYISRACSSLVRQPYYAPNSFILIISGLETILATKKVYQHDRAFHMDEYTLIFLFSHCIRCAQKRDCWECKRIAFVPHRVVGIQMGSMSVGRPTELRPSIWAYSSAGSASVSLLCPTELWAFKWGVCRLVAQPSHVPKYGPIAQLGAQVSTNKSTI